LIHTFEIIEQGKAVEEASKAMILLHGRGADANDILSLANQICDSSFYVAAPQATYNSWYPNSFMEEEASNEPWLTSAVDTVKRLIDEIARSIPKSQIYIVGFSQGACLALEVSARYAEKYGGIIAFTGGLIGKTIERGRYKGDFKGTKVFIGTSDQDPHIPLSRSEESIEVMRTLGAEATLKVYPGMGHQINVDEIDWVNQNITQRSRFPDG
jgi:phospholipase/carboxylesterase